MAYFQGLCQFREGKVSIQKLCDILSEHPKHYDVPYIYIIYIYCIYIYCFIIYRCLIPKWHIPNLVPHVMDDHPIIHPLQAILMVYSSCRWHVCRYCIYTWNLEMSSILVVESSKTKSFPIKTLVYNLGSRLICSLQALPMLTTLYP